MPAKKPKDERKDKIIQTRVNEALDDRLKQEAKRRRLPVSQLIRNLLEDSFELVGNVVDNVDAIAQDAIGLGRQAGADAQRLARRASKSVSPAPHRTDADAEEVDDATPRDASPAPAPEVDLTHVLAWQPIVLNAATPCSACTKALERGEEAFMGLTSTPGQIEWLCDHCRADL